MKDPAAELTPPRATEPIPEDLNTALHLGDLISLGHWAMVALEAMGGPNIPEEVGTWFAGDWKEVSIAADALRKLGAFCATACDGIKEELAVLMRTWEGRAADAAEAYFGRLATALAAQEANFLDIADQYARTALGIKELANVVGGLVESLADCAIVAGISLAAAGITSWTGVGLAVGGAGAAAAILRGATLVKQLLELRAKVWNVAEAVVGLIAASLGAIHGFTSEKLPGAYNHSLVT